MDSGVHTLLVMLLAFACVALVAYVAASGFMRRTLVRQQYGALSTGRDMAGSASRRGRRIDASRLGVDAETQRKLRRELIRAGYFSQDGVAIYTIARWSTLLLLPLIGLVLLATLFSGWDATTRIAVAALIALIAYYLPSAFISRRQRLLQDKYRVTFPDFLDMLVVCVNAGLSLDAALDRVARELGPEDAELRANLDLMAGEMRAGKSAVEALKDCAERLGLPEALSLATLLQQSIELGTDVALSLTTFSDEMRDKRMSRAEETAAALPPKLTLPLGLFIFPVVLIVILAPVVLRIMKAAGV
jgi:tight adherence protein C